MNHPSPGGEPHSVEGRARTPQPSEPDTHETTRAPDLRGAPPAHQGRPSPGNRAGANECQATAPTGLDRVVERPTARARPFWFGSVRRTLAASVLIGTVPVLVILLVSGLNYRATVLEASHLDAVRLAAGAERWTRRVLQDVGGEHHRLSTVAESPFEPSLFPEGTCLVIADANGVCLYRFPSLSNVAPPGQSLPTTLWQQVQQTPESGTFTSRDLDRERYTYAHREIGPGGDRAPALHCLVGIPETGLRTTLTGWLLRNGVLAALATAGALGASFALGNRQLIQVIDRIGAAARAIRAGELHARANLPCTLGGELGDLARGFDQMASGLEQDRTERETAQKALREQEEKYRLVVESGAEAIVVAQHGRLEFANARTAELSGYDRQELLSRPFIELLHPEDRERAIANHAARLSGAAIPVRVRYRMIHRTGRTLWAEVAAVPVPWNGAMAVLMFLTDVTARTAAEDRAQAAQRETSRLLGLAEQSRQALLSLAEDHRATETALEDKSRQAEQERRNLQALFDASPISMMLFNSRAELMRVNRVVERTAGVANAAALLGRSGGSGLGCYHSRFGDRCGDTPGCPDCQFLATVQGVLATGEPALGIELRSNLLRDGAPHEVWLMFSCVPIVTEGERGALGAIVDITDRKAAELELARHRDHLEELVHQRTAELDAANRAKSAFLANMSHEIRTPLNAVLGYAQLLERDALLTEPSRAKLKIINRSGEHLLSLINAVLEMAKIDSGRLTVEMSNFDLAGLLADMKSMFVLRAEARGLTFRVVTPDSARRQIRVDQAKVRQVLVNLLGNAFKFTADGQVELEAEIRRTAGEQAWLDVEVRDTGPGITVEEQARLFRPFEQTTSGRRVQAGTGLGLAISRRYAQLLGGDLTLESEPGQGSTFRFRVPVELVDSAVVANAQVPVLRERLAPGRSPPRILLVDDHPENRGWLSELLGQAGFQVREAADGGEAVSTWEAWEPDLVLMDLRLPVLDGYEATRRIRALPRGGNALIVALTAAVYEPDRAAILAAGAAEVLTKPLEASRLFECLRRRLAVELVPAADIPPDAASGLPDTASPLVPADLDILTEALRGDLRAALMNGDSRRMARLLDDISKLNAALGARLKPLIRDYAYDHLARLLPDRVPDHET